MALADLLTSYGVNLPDEVSQVVLTVLRRRPNTVLSLPTGIKVSACKHLLANDRHAEQALYSAHVRSKRFEPIATRDATFRAYFGRIEFFFVYPLTPSPADPDGGALLCLLATSQ